MKRTLTLLAPLLLLALEQAGNNAASALIPASPQEQTSRAVRSLRTIIDDLTPDDEEEKRSQKVRLFVDYLIPLPPETKDEDIDPWPGGLAQMYPYAEGIAEEILRGVVDDPAGPCSSQILSAEDCCGLLVQESRTSARNDAAAVIFPGVDQLRTLERVDEMVGDRRTLIIFNRQFQRPADFGFAGNAESKRVVFDQYRYGFAFQEFACRGEDVKLTFEHPNWRSCAICDENVDEGRKEIALLGPSTERPSYESLERRINEVLPEPLWMRKMGEAQDKGLKFQRRQ